MTPRLLALDIDGTLIGASETIAPEIVDAVEAVEAAGIGVVLTTGRDYRQTVDIWRQLRLRQPAKPLVLVSGAMVAEADGGRTLYQKTMPRQTACRVSEAMSRRGRTVLAYVDPWRYALEYYIVEADDAAAVREKWLDRKPRQYRVVGRLDEALPAAGPLRISAIVPDRATATRLADALRREFADELVVSPLYVPAMDLTIVEATAARANKWTGLLYVAQGLRIKPAEIAAVGDDANDLPMLRGAGRSAAMPGAPREVREAADEVVAGGLAAWLRTIATDHT